MDCNKCEYNLFDEELGRKCCQFGSEQDRGFKAPCAVEVQGEKNPQQELLFDLMLEQKEQM